MKLQKCEHCNAKFKWSDINKSLWLAYRPIKCRQCGTKHKVLIASRFALAVVTVPIVVLVIFLIDSYNLSLFPAIILSFVLTVLVSPVFPYTVKYSDEF